MTLDHLGGALGAIAATSPLGVAGLDVVDAVGMRKEATVYTPYPGEPAMFAATQALVDAHQKGKALPASQWFQRDSANALVRDAKGNALGGVRYGLMELGLAEFLGAVQGGDMNGVANVITADEFYQDFKNRSQYLAKQRAFDNRLRQQGYLTADGQALFVERANIVLDSIGIS